MVLQLTVWKARLVTVGLVLLLAWPPVHFLLVERYRLNPWKFFGFAMYCVPTLPVEIEMYGTEGREYPIPAERLPVPAQALIQRFRTNRQVVGTWHEPELLGRVLLRVRPQAESARIVVRQPYLDPRTGLVDERVFSYVYGRSDEPE